MLSARSIGHEAAMASHPRRPARQPQPAAPGRPQHAYANILIRPET